MDLIIANDFSLFMSVYIVFDISDNNLVTMDALCVPVFDVSDSDTLELGELCLN